MIQPNVDPKEWAERYQIEVRPGNCAKCGATINFTIPFAYGKMRGFLGDHLDCGEEYRQLAFVSVDKEFNQSLFGIFESIAEDLSK